VKKGVSDQTIRKGDEKIPKGMSSLVSRKKTGVKHRARGLGGGHQGLLKELRKIADSEVRTLCSLILQKEDLAARGMKAGWEVKPKK